MKRIVQAAFCLVPLAIASAAQPARARCAPLKPGGLYPWQSNERMPGDKWAELQIKVDSKGQAVDCRVAGGNADADLVFAMCRAMISGRHFALSVKDGEAESGIVKRTIVMSGRTHIRADEAARKKYFAGHPDDSPSCYPE